METIFNENGITVTEKYSKIIGIEYCVSDGFTSFTTSVMPELNYTVLHNQLIDYAWEKYQSHYISPDMETECSPKEN